MGKIMERIKKAPVFYSLALTVSISMVGMLFLELLSLTSGWLAEAVFSGLFVGLFVFYPLLLTVINLAALFFIPKDVIWQKNLKKFEYVSLVLGLLYFGLLLSVMELFDVIIAAKWDEVLYNYQKHQPVWTGAWPTVFVLCAVGILGYLVLSLFKLEKLPPLVIVLSMSAMYLGVSQCLLWCIQLCEISPRAGIACLFPFNCIVIVLKTIRGKIAEWNLLGTKEETHYEEKPVLGALNRKLGNAAYWPVFALVFMLPLLGVILCILVLCGQRPDDLIKAWTETADWRLSQQTAPQNAWVDEHYLCTVAAGGHAQIVKPLRMGERHGHRVVVNRQLCIANAFEQILEERLPKFHRLVRHVYDTCGFPIARLIRTKTAADIVYILMKPLEWIFLIVLYLCDTKPENRIAVQYLPRR
ncbi:MAG: hypothetical protein NC124_07970 [Clostridium sp.]|nr:hypothetical protein [Clostridium sp.]